MDDDQPGRDWSEAGVWKGPEEDSAASGSGGESEDSAPPVDLSDRETPWVETRAGGLFFINALLVAPELVVLFPLLLGAILRALGLLEGPSRFIDTIPQVAAYVLPWVGWVLVVPLWTTMKNLRMEGVGPWARRALHGMAALHVAFLGYTVWRWIMG